ncbi:MAG: AAA family ATPase [Candidatus Micrarchaeota archaeon]|nr:AAA family ATPase [Candidatus Micrarchaeota archaeon]
MKLIVIYGPPAVGKLTVANELSKLTGYRILHNHLALDLLETVLDRSDSRYWELFDKYRLELIESAAKAGRSGLILTSVNIAGKDDGFVKELINVVERNSGTMHFVRLSCERTELERRIMEPSRKRYNKLTDIGIFDEFVKENDVFSPISFVESYSIDNTGIPPVEVAKLIKGHYGL